MHPAAAHKAVIGYIFPQDHVLYASGIAPQRLTCINYAFANIRKGQIVEGFSHDSDNLRLLVSLKAQNPSLRVMISVGGWSWSGAFSDAALTSKSRTLFAESAVGFVRDHRLDGIDLDWEYPGLAGSGNKHRREDKHNFTALLRTLRESLDEEAKAVGRPLFLSIAAGASEEYIANTELATIQNLVNSINLMSYDYYVPSVDHTTGHHAPLYPNSDEPKGASASGSVQLFLHAGVPEAKIVLGVPFYGHAWTQVADLHHGLFQHGRKSELEPDYRAIRNLLSQGGFKRYWDKRAAAPYLYDSVSRTFITYEDPESLRLKCQFALRENLAGVMFWEYSNDFKGELLNTIASTFRVARH